MVRAPAQPAAPNTHQTAQAIAADARVAYVDNDAVVLSHLRALAAKGDPRVTVADGDVREAAAILDAVTAGIDLSAPAPVWCGLLSTGTAQAPSSTEPAGTAGRRPATRVPSIR